MDTQGRSYSYVLILIEWPEGGGELSFPIVAAAGDRLGSDYDPEAVRGLNLPTFSSGQMRSGNAGEEVAEMPTPERGDAGEVSSFILSEALPVVPVKLVKWIVKGELVDMAELLKDNMEAERHCTAIEGESSRGLLGQRESRREVPDILSWLQCFTAYVAVLCSWYPAKAKELWAYQATMISEDRRCGGKGWSVYHALFQQQITSIEAADFSKINQGLYATTFLAYGGRGQFCQSCLASDHTHSECVLHPNQSVPVVRVGQAAVPQVRNEGPQWQQDPKRSVKGSCVAWNDGMCTGPYCKYSHVCPECYSRDHRRPWCRTKGVEPSFRREQEDWRLCF